MKPLIRAIAALLALCLLASGAEAQTARRLMLMGSAKSSFPAAGSLFDINIATGQSFGCTISTCLSNARVGTTATDLLYTDPPGVAYTTYAANVLRIKTGAGPLIEDATTNLIVNPTAPATQTITIGSTGNYSLWVNGVPNTYGIYTLTAGTATITINTAGGIAQNGTYVSFNVSVVGTVVVTLTGSLSVAQMEKRIAPTSFTLTTRNSDDVSAIGPLKALLQAATGTVMMSINGIPNANTTFLGDNTNTQQFGNNFNNLGGLVANNGTNSFTATLGNGTTAIPPFTAGLKWDATSRSLVGNGGTVVAHAGTTTFGATPKVGGVVNLSPFIDTTISRIIGWATTLPDAAFQSFSIVPGGNLQIAGWGDSLGVTFQTLGATFSPPRVVQGASFAGQNSTFIAGKMVADTTSNTDIEVWWTGIHDGPTWSTATFLTNLASMVAHTTGGRYLICQIITTNQWPSGSSDYIGLQNLNAAAASTYPTRIVPCFDNLVAAYNPGNPIDVINHAAGQVPFTLHANDAPGTLTQSILSTDTTFTISDNSLVPSNILTIGSEYIYIISATGSTITSATRGYAGTTAAGYANGTAYVATDPTHLNAAGYAVVNKAIHDKIVSMGAGWN